MTTTNPIPTHTRFHSFAGVALALGLLAGCATTPPPSQQMAVSRAAVESARAAGGNQYAPVELQQAMTKLDAAEQAMAREDYAEARTLAEQAEVDARLASAKANSTKAQRASAAVEEDIRVLRQEIDRAAR